MNEPADQLATLVVGPEDRLVISLPDDVSDHELFEFIAELNRQGWTERTLIVRGGQLAVIKSGGGH